MANIVITGGAGFIGKNLAKTLSRIGYTVTIVDDFSGTYGKNRNKYDIYNELNKLKIIELKLGSRQNDFYQDAKYHHLFIDAVKNCDAVIHLAATVGVSNVLNNPIETIQNNIDATHTVLNDCEAYKKPCFIASTSEIYGKSGDNKNALKETDDVVYGKTSESRWAYATSKYIDEIIALQYAKNNAVYILRFFNVSGIGQDSQYGMVIPKFITQALLDEPITIFGNGSQTRSFTHIDDVCFIITQLLISHFKSALVDRVLNIGSANPISVLDLANKIIEKTNSSSKINLYSEHHTFNNKIKEFADMQHRTPDITLLKKYIGEHPFKSVDDIIDDIIEADGNKILEQNPKFINSYNYD